MQAEKTSLISISKTKAAFNKVLADFTRFCLVFGIITQIFFIIYGTYSLLTSLDNPKMLSVKAVTLAILVAYFIFDIATVGKKKLEQVKTLREAVAFTSRIIKYLINAAVIGITAYEVLNGGAEMMAIISLAIMTVAFVIKILAEIVRFIFSRYVSLIMLGIQMDMESVQESFLGKAVGRAVDALENKRATVVELIDKPLAAISARMGREPQPDEAETVAEAADEIVEAADAKDRALLTALAEESSDLDKIKRVEKEEKKKARLEDAVSSLKGHVKSIFSRKKK